MFVLEKMKANLLLPLFEPIVSTLFFSTESNNFYLIKLKLPSGAELKVSLKITRNCIIR